MRFFVVLLMAAAMAAGQVVPQVRQFAQAGDFQAGESLIRSVKGSGAWTPELLLAYSWLGRGAQANKKWDAAFSYSAETRKLALEMLKGRAFDAEPNLPLALGASIEVNGHALANTGRRSEGVSFLKQELQRWKATSMRMRIQKNLHLLSLEGQRAPRLEATVFAGTVKMKSLDDFRGRPVLLFLWAHWCADCKAQGAVIEGLRKEFPSMAVIAPTQRYGYVANGEDAPKEIETPYIGAVQRERFPWMSAVPIPVSEENFGVYGVSSTPTLVLLDKTGIVRMYHPGQMKAEELRQALATVLK
jgi:thiol-disulfide isomerase/thioredoxin